MTNNTFIIQDEKTTKKILKRKQVKIFITWLEGTKTHRLWQLVE
jgi:hypothetical protein